MDAPTKSVNPSAQLGKEEFLKLLVAQLRNQNPLEPMKDREFIAQLAQMNTVEQLQNLNSRTDSLLVSQAVGQASELIGRNVEVQDADLGPISGTVSKVTFDGNGPQLVVGGKSYRMADVNEVS